MKTFFGIVPTFDGQYTMVALKAVKSGCARIVIKRWNCHDKIKTALLLHREVFCGLPSFWKSEKSRVAEDVLVAGEADKSFSSCVSRADHAFHQATLAGNIAGIVTDDAFLCTLPLYLGDPSIHSFISVYARKTHFEIGITKDGKLIAVFKMAPCSEQTLEAHLKRMQLYWARTCPHINFPDHVYLLGDAIGLSSSRFSARPLVMIIDGHEFKNDDEIRALGVALAQSAGAVPAFPVQSVKSSLRLARVLLYAASVSMVLFAVLMTGAPLVAGKIADIKIKGHETRFRSAIANDGEIKALLTENEALARGILQYREKSSTQTNWAPFLHLLGMQRPDGLYFELLGSEPLKGSPGVRVALSGWARSEKLVADFISLVQKNDRVSNISLSSMDKNEKNPNLCNFKIVCVLKINM